MMKWIKSAEVTIHEEFNFQQLLWPKFVAFSYLNNVTEIFLQV